jgi:hypothetical protein
MWAYSLTQRPPPMTSLPRLTEPGANGTCNKVDNSSWSCTVVRGCTCHRQPSKPHKTLNKGDSYQSTLITQRTVTPHEDIPRNSLSKNLDTKNIPNNLLRLTFNVGVDQSDIVIARNDIAQRRQPFLNTLNFNRLGDGVSQVKEFLICRWRGDKQSSSISFPQVSFPFVSEGAFGGGVYQPWVCRWCEFLRWMYGPLVSHRQVQPRKHYDKSSTAKLRNL